MIAHDSMIPFTESFKNATKQFIVQRYVSIIHKCGKLWKPLLTQQSETGCFWWGLLEKTRLGGHSEIFSGVNNGLMYKGYISVYYFIVYTYITHTLL